MVNPLSYVFYYFQKLWYITIVLRDKIKIYERGYWSWKRCLNCWRNITLFTEKAGAEESWWQTEIFRTMISRDCFTELTAMQSLLLCGSSFIRQRTVPLCFKKNNDRQKAAFSALLFCRVFLYNSHINLKSEREVFCHTERSRHVVKAEGTEQMSFQTNAPSHFFVIKAEKFGDGIFSALCSASWTTP